MGLWQYGHTALAAEIASQWVASVYRVFLNTGRLLEKYGVMEDRAGGGECETQDGSGWTNATYSAFSDQVIRSVRVSDESRQVS